jgi:anti-sigma-K factor RskA
MDRQTLLDLIPAYALGALDEAERAEVDALLASDAEAQKLLAEYQGVTQDMALMTPARQAPAHLGADLRQRLAASRTGTQEARVTRVDTQESKTVPTAATRETAETRAVRPARRRVAWVPVLVGTLAAVAVVAVGLMLLLRPASGQDIYNRLSGQPGAQRFPVAGQGVAGELVASPDGKEGVLRVAQLPSITQDRTFQLWLIDEGGPKSGGLFRAGDGDVAYVVLPLAGRKLSDFKAVAVSVEPAGGSPDANGPSTPPIASAAVTS